MVSLRHGHQMCVRPSVGRWSVGPWGTGPAGHLGSLGHLGLRLAQQRHELWSEMRTDKEPGMYVYTERELKTKSHNQNSSFSFSHVSWWPSSLNPSLQCRGHKQGITATRLGWCSSSGIEPDFLSIFTLWPSECITPCPHFNPGVFTSEFIINQYTVKENPCGSNHCGPVIEA